LVYDPPLSTFEPTKRNANVQNINTIPGEDIFNFDCRILPEYDIDSVTKTINEVTYQIQRDFGVKIEVRYPQLLRAAPPTSVNAPAVCLLSEAIHTVRKVEPRPVGIGGGTVAALFRHRGIPAVVWSTVDDMAHQPNEYCVIDNMVDDAKVFAHVFVHSS
jgi:succinyl-diaminopimelate desuccinylase